MSQSITKTLTFLSLILSLFSCSKSEKDFVGKYSTYYATKIQVADAFAPLMMGLRTKKNQHMTTAKVFNDLGEIKLDLFMDEQKKTLSGEASFVLKEAVNMSFNPQEKTQSIALDISNIRLNKDTLEFSLDNQMLKLSGKRIIGKLFKNGDTSVLALGKEIATNPVVSTSPFYLTEKNGLLFFNCYDDTKTKEMVHAYFKKQEEDLMQKIKTEADPTAKQIAQNSLKEVQARM